MRKRTHVTTASCEYDCAAQCIASTAAGERRGMAIAAIAAVRLEVR